MKSLEPQDSLHLRAAQGWLELGDHLEANVELEKISPRLRMHPDVLLLRYEIFAKAKLWEAAFYVAQALVEVEPKEPCGWINQAFALRKMSPGGLVEIAAHKFMPELHEIYPEAYESCGNSSGSGKKRA